MSQPTTEAGRALIQRCRQRLHSRLAEQLVPGILAIEQEAAAIDVERLARALRTYQPSPGIVDGVIVRAGWTRPDDSDAEAIAAEYARLGVTPEQVREKPCLRCGVEWEAHQSQGHPFYVEGEIPGE